MTRFVQRLFKRFPYASRMILGALLVIVAFILSGLIEKAFQIKPYFPFTGMLLLLGVTWILYRTEGQDLSQLGLNFSIRNCGLLFLGLVIGALAFPLAKWLRAAYTGEDFGYNLEYDIDLMLAGFYYVLPMVAVEELLFRGYFFKRTISASNVIIANVVFSILFMLVHVLDWEVLSNPGMVLFLAVTITVGHLWFATALLKSGTLMFPIGLHWGNNWATLHLISEASSPGSPFYVANPASFESWGSFVVFLLIWNGFYLLLTYLTWKWPIANSLGR